jgi:hypothetical protein
MLRIGLTIYLIVATATGPSLCCCTALALALFHSAAKHPTTPKDQDETAHACCHHRHPATFRATREEPSHPAHTCSCGDSRPELVLSPSSPRAVIASSAELPAFGQDTLIPHSSDPASVALSAANSASRGFCACPCARAVLDSRHILRC